MTDRTVSVVRRNASRSSDRMETFGQANRRGQGPAPSARRRLFVATGDAIGDSRFSLASGNEGRFNADPPQSRQAVRGVRACSFQCRGICARPDSGRNDGGEHFTSLKKNSQDGKELHPELHPLSCPFPVLMQWLTPETDCSEICTPPAMAITKSTSPRDRSREDQQS